MALDLSKFYSDNNFKIESKYSYGIYKDRVISIIEKGTYAKVTIAFNVQLQREKGAQISAKMSEIKMKHRALQNALTTNVALELIIYLSADANQEFFEVLEDSLNVLDQYHPAVLNTCAICGTIMPSDSPFAKVKDIVIQGHESCINQLIVANGNIEQKMNKISKKELIKSILVAFVCMLVVVGIVSILSIYGAFSIVSLLSGWGCLLLYKFIAPKMKISFKRTHLIIVTCFSIISVVAGIYFGSILDIYFSNEGFVLADVFKNYFVLLIKNFDTYGKYIVISFVLSLSFVLSTVFANFRQFKQQKEGIKKL